MSAFCKLFLERPSVVKVPRSRVLYSPQSKAFALSWNSRNTRSALIVALLLVSLVIAALLAAQAYFASRYQRAAAESVLRDYSSLVADEAIRRVTADVGYYGYYVLVTAVLREAQRSPHLPSDLKDTFAASPEQGLRDAATLAKSYLQLDPALPRVSFTSEVPPPAVFDLLQKRLIADRLIECIAQGRDRPLREPRRCNERSPQRGRRKPFALTP